MFFISFSSCFSTVSVRFVVGVNKALAPVAVTGRFWALVERGRKAVCNWPYRLWLRAVGRFWGGRHGVAMRAIAHRDN
jgi:hypothetical protein